MDVLLSIIIALVVFGVSLAVIRFCITKWFPEFVEYFRIIVMVLCAALFIYILVAIWPFLTGAMGSHRL